jgi:hypothetical protein
MEWIFDNIVQYLKDGNWVTAAQLMGAICHFAADATCPLHATWDYGASPGYHHSEYETAVNNHISEISIPDNYVPQELDDITNAALVTLAESFDFTDEDPNGGVNICDFLEVGISWNATIKSITENRVRAAVQFTANIWYTAMVRAGLASSVTSSVDAITPYWRTSIPFTITATAGASAQSVSLYYRYSTDNSSWGGWTFFGNDYSSPYSWSFTASQGDGYYEFYSIAMDENDNVESPPAVADARCGVDRVAPASSVNTISPYWRTSTSFQITATASDATSGVKDISLYYRYSTDNSSWSAWALYGTDTVAPWMWSVVAPSGSGYYEFYSIARDKATNAESAPTEADTRCGIDIAGPYAPAKSSPADGTTTNNNKPTFTWSATTDNLSGIARYELWVDDDPDFSSPEILENTTDNATTSYSPATELVNGNYSWRVRAWDQVGNPGPFESTWTFLINTTPPPARRGVEVSISPSSQSGTPGTTLTYTVTVTNTGTVTEDYNLSKTYTRSWNLMLPPSVVDVVPDEDRQITLSVGIPATAENNTSDNITVTATSTENTAIENSASCTARCVKNVVVCVTSLTISPSRFALYPGYTGQVQALTVTLRDSNYNLLANKVITWSATAGSVSPSSGTTDAVGQISVTCTAPIVTTQTSATITASFAGDDLYGASSGTSSGIPAIPVSVNISASGGTVVINVIEINVTVNVLVVPPNALSENTAITVVQAPLENLPDYKMVSHVFDVGPSGTTFTTPSTLTLPYDENELPAGVSEDNLAIYRRTSAGGSWERVGGNVDKMANTVSVQIDHLSEYAVMVSIGGEAAPPPSHDLLPIAVGGVVAVGGAGVVIAVLSKKGIIHLPSVHSRFLRLPTVSITFI